MGLDPNHGPGPGAAHSGERDRSRSGAAKSAANRGAVRPAGYLGPARARQLAILGLPAMTGQMIALDGGQHLQWSARQTDAGPEE